MEALSLLLLGLLPTLALGQLQGTYAVGARAEAAGRTPYAGEAAGPSVDVALFPEAKTQASAGAWQVSGLYTPTLRMREANAGPQEGVHTAPGRRLEHHHGLSWLAEYRREGCVRPYARQLFSYGRFDWLAAWLQAPSTSGTPQPLPLQHAGSFVLTDLVLETEAGADFPLSRRWVLTAFVGHTWGGGLNAPSRSALSMARTPFGGLQSLWQLTARDALLLNVAARYSFFLSKPAEAGTWDSYGTWKHTLDESTELALSAGLSAYGNRPAPAASAFEWHLAPYAALGVVRRFAWEGHTLQAEAKGKLAPFVDRYAALAYERAEASIHLQWRWKDIYSNAHGGLGRGLGAKAKQLSMTAYYAELLMGYRINPCLRVEFRGSHAAYWVLPPVGGGQNPLVRTGQWRAALGLSAEYSGSY